MDKAEEASGLVVDLPPTKLEGFGLELLLKKVAAYTPKQFHLAADGDMQVKIVAIFLSPTFVTNIRHQNFVSSTSVTKILCHQHPSPKILCRQHPSPIFLSPIFRTFILRAPLYEF